MASSQEPRKPSRYRDIAAELQKEIRLGTYSVRNLLPTETELMARYTASRQTIREALRIVIEQGLIVRRAGLGSIVIATEPPVLFTRSVTRRRPRDTPICRRTVCASALLVIVDCSVMTVGPRAVAFYLNAGARLARMPRIIQPIGRKCHAIFSASHFSESQFSENHERRVCAEHRSAVACYRRFGRTEGGRGGGDLDMGGGAWRRRS
jgi:DNA-binding transcriptional MocR family regulator